MADVGELLIHVRSRVQGALQGLEAVRQKTEGVADRLDKASRSVRQAGQRMTLGVTAPAAAAGGLAVKEFADFDQKLTESQAIMGDLSEGMKDDMAEAARDVAKSTTFAADEAAESFFFLSSAGLDAEQSVAALPQVAEFAQAGMFDLQTATDLATDAQSALGLASQDAAENQRNLRRVTDTLVKANTLANASVEQFSQSLTRKAGAALKNTGKSIEEGVAALSAFADQGLKGQRAGVALDRVLQQLPQQAQKNAEAFEEYGISIFDAEGKMRSISEIVGQFEEQLGGMSDEQKTAAFEALGLGRRLGNNINQLMGTSDAIEEYRTQLEEAGGTTKNVADNQLQSLTAQLKLTFSQIRDVAITFGKDLVPVVKRAQGVIEGIASRLQELSPSTRRLIVVLTGIAAAIGPVLIAVGLMGQALAALLSPMAGVVAAVAAFGGSIVAAKAKAVGVEGVLQRIGQGFTRVKQAAGRVADMVRPLAERVFNLLVSRGASVAGMAKSLGKALMDAGPGIVSMATKLWDTLKPVLADVQAALGDLVDWVASNLPGLVSGLQPVVDDVVDLFETAAEVAGEVKTAFMEAFSGADVEGLLRSLAEDAKALVQEGLRLARNTLEDLKPLLVTVASLVGRVSRFLVENKTIVMAAAAAFTAFQILVPVISLLASVAGAITGVVGTISASGGLIAALTAAVTPVTAVAAALAGIVAVSVLIVKEWDTIKGTLSSVWGSIKDGMTKAWRSIKEATSDAWDRIRAAVERGARLILAFFFAFTPLGILLRHIMANWDKIHDATAKAWQAIKNRVQALAMTLLNWFLTFTPMGRLIQLVIDHWETIRDTTSRIWNTLTDTVETLVRALISPVADLAGDVKDAVVDAWEGAKRRTAEVWGKVKSAIVDPITDVLGKVFDWGKDIVQGLIDGVLDKLQDAKGAAVRVITGMWEAGKEAAGIESPSKLFAEMGGQLMAGLQVGVDDKTVEFPDLARMFQQTQTQPSATFDVPAMRGDHGPPVHKFIAQFGEDALDLGPDWTLEELFREIQRMSNKENRRHRGGASR